MRWTDRHSSLARLAAALAVAGVMVAGLVSGYRRHPVWAPMRERAPLVAAAQAGDAVRVRLLLRDGADPNRVNDAGWSPLVGAAWKGSVPIARMLVARGAKLDLPDFEGSTPLWMATFMGQEAMVRYLVGAGADVNAQNRRHRRPPLMDAVWLGERDIAVYLLKHGAHADTSDDWGRTPLTMALGGGDTAMVQLLLAHGARVVPGDRASSAEVVRAALAGDVEALRKRLDAGDSPDSCDKQGVRALMAACRLHRAAAADLLLARGARVDLMDMGNNTVVSHAVLGGCIEQMARMIRLGADPNAANVEGATPLKLAADAGLTDAATALLRCGADPNSRNGYGQTPLALAAMNGHAPVVRALIAAGADVNALPAGAKESDRRSALRCARDGGHAAVVKTLQAAGARE
jgi:ankyrin repeat protein